MKMSPISLYESGESNGKISLSELFIHPDLNIDGIQSDTTVEGLIYAVCRGGWPATFKCRTDRARLKIAYNCLKSTCDRDITQVDGVKRKSEIAYAILRSYAQGEDAKVSYYHDRNGLEADVVLHLKDGRYALIECKLGSKEIEDGAAHLVELRKLIVENNKGETQVPLRKPDLLIVLTGGNLAYTREDGVKVIPLACLKW